jgi:hypothetical protein
MPDEPGRAIRSDAPGKDRGRRALGRLIEDWALLYQRLDSQVPGSARAGSIQHLVELGITRKGCRKVFQEDLIWPRSGGSSSTLPWDTVEGSHEGLLLIGVTS